MRLLSKRSRDCSKFKREASRHEDGWGNKLRLADIEVYWKNLVGSCLFLLRTTQTLQQNSRQIVGAGETEETLARR